MQAKLFGSKCVGTHQASGCVRFLSWTQSSRLKMPEGGSVPIVVPASRPAYTQVVWGWPTLGDLRPFSPRSQETLPVAW